jgi:hypothetical protein
MSSYFKFFPNQEALDGMAKSGIPLDVVPVLGFVEILCTIIFLIPQTAVLGAILLTGYLGGAIFAHVRMEDAFILPLIFGILIWGSLFLKDERIRSLLPLRK